MHIFPEPCDFNSHDNMKSQIISLNIYGQIHLVSAEFFILLLLYQ